MCNATWLIDHADGWVFIFRIHAFIVTIDSLFVDIVPPRPQVGQVNLSIQSSLQWSIFKKEQGSLVYPRRRGHSVTMGVKNNRAWDKGSSKPRVQGARFHASILFSRSKHIFCFLYSLWPRRETTQREDGSKQNTWEVSNKGVLGEKLNPAKIMSDSSIISFQHWSLCENQPKNWKKYEQMSDEKPAVKNVNFLMHPTVEVTIFERRREQRSPLVTTPFTVCHHLLRQPWGCHAFWNMWAMSFQ